MSTMNTSHDPMPKRVEPLFGLCIAVSVLSTCSIIIRFWSRSLLIKPRFQADDWLALAAWPAALYSAIASAMISIHFEDIAVSDTVTVQTTLKIAFASRLAWVVALGLIRSSAVLFYSRLFSHTNPEFRRFTTAGVIANVLWVAIMFFILLFQCIPVQSMWNPAAVGHCISTIQIQCGSAVSSIVLDLYTLLLPMPQVWKLRMSSKKRVLTIATFALGYCVIITTIGRTVKVVGLVKSHVENVPFYFPTFLYWGVAELGVAHITISLPSAFALWRRARQHGLSSLFNSKYFDMLFGNEHLAKLRQMSLP